MGISGIAGAPTGSLPANSQSLRGDPSKFDSRVPRLDDGHCTKIGCGTALRAFRHELRMSLQAQFNFEFRAQQPAFAANAEATGPEDVANEALGVARRVVAQSPTTAMKSLVAIRSRVEESAGFAREAIGGEEDFNDVRETLARIGAGLADLEAEAVAIREASSSILDVDMSTRQRSKITIRTQEGDVVKLSLKREDAISASTSQETDGDSLVSNTEIEFSSRSRMLLSVRGDLNEAELSAVQAVIEQAQKIADAFFGGDIGAAFNSAQGMEFDSDQLASVDMRFRMRQVTNVTYSETTRARPVLSEIPTPVIGETPVPAVESKAGPESAPTSAPVVSKPVSMAIPVKDLPVPGQNISSDIVSPSRDSISAFIEMIGSFLRSANEGFDTGVGNTSINYRYSQSFKLQILQAVIHAVAPDDAGDAGSNAVEAIENLKEAESE